MVLPSFCLLQFQKTLLNTMLLRLTNIILNGMEDQRRKEDAELGSLEFNKDTEIFMTMIVSERLKCITSNV